MRQRRAFHVKSTETTSSGFFLVVFLRARFQRGSQDIKHGHHSFWGLVPILPHPLYLLFQG